MRPWLTSAALVLLIGCEAIRADVDIGLEFPRDDAPLSTTNNATVVLTPDGFVDQFATDGPTFALEVELEPDSTARALEVYLARDDTLLGYGRTPPFTYGGAEGAGVRVFIGFPGALATLERTFDLPDAGTIATGSPGRGAVALGSDGSAVFFDTYTLDLVPIASFPDDPPLATDGTFVGDASGSVTRISIDDAVVATRYVYGADRWDVAPLADESRTGAGIWFDPTQARAYVAGGGTQTNVLAIEVVPENLSTPTASILEGVTLDGPRAGAALHGNDEGPDLLVVGGDDPSQPLVLDPTSGRTYAQPQAWTGLRCVSLDTTRVLCAGGEREGTVSPDALLIDRTDPGAWRVETLVDLLPLPMREVVWLEDETAVYAQGEARLTRIQRADLTVDEPPGAPVRAIGGSAAVLPTGAVLLVGGQDTDGAATSVWQVFSPDLPSP